MQQMTGKAIDMNKVTIKYLTNGLGEDTGFKEIPPAAREWYDEQIFGSLPYLAELDDQIGIMLIAEINHPEDGNGHQDRDWMSREWLEASPEKIMGHLRKKADELAASLDFMVLIGDSTGFLECHEVTVFVPMNADMEKARDADRRLSGMGFYY